MLQPSVVKTAGYLGQLVGFDLVANFHVVIALKLNTTLAALLDLADLVLVMTQ